MRRFGLGWGWCLALASLLAACGAPGGEGVTINGTTVPPAPTLAAAEIARGAELYAQHCAACHGAQLEGQPNWKTTLADGARPAPPHDASGHTWHHSDAVLRWITAQGGGAFSAQSRMPAFGQTLSAAEVEAILTFIKSRWGPAEREYQWWMTATGADAAALPATPP